MKFPRIFENFLWRKDKGENLISKPDKIDKSLENILETNQYTVWRLISQLRDVSQTREYKYAEYDIMSAEVIINAALNMYADDSTQVDINSGHVLSITSSDEILVKDLYAFLEKINFENFVWDVAYSLAKYGNKYLKVYLSEDGKDISHLEAIDDPGCVLDLYRDGKPMYFAENYSDKTLYKEANQINLYNHDAFIHYYIRSTSQSETLEISDNSKVNANGEPVVLRYKIIEGESLLEGVRVVYRILQSLEDSLLAARLAKSDYIRVFNIEVGNSSTTDTRLIVNKVKKLFDSTVSLDIRNGKYHAMKQPRAWADPIFNATSSGKGAISIENIGGDFEVKSIVDIDYFTNKLFAGLRIPKPFLGFEEALGGSLDQSGTLSQLDIRYSRFIRKIIDAVVLGTQTLCNLWLRLRGRNTSINNFKVVYTSPSSLEDYSNLKEIKERAAIVSDLVSTIVDHAEGINSTKVLKELLNQFVPYQSFLDKIRPLLEEAIKSQEPEEDEGEDEDIDMDFGGDDIDFDYSSEPAPSSPSKSSPSPGPKPSSEEPGSEEAPKESPSEKPAPEKPSEEG